MKSRNSCEGTFKKRHQSWNRKRTVNRNGKKRTKLYCKGTWENSNRLRRIYALFGDVLDETAAQIKLAKE